MPLTVIWGVAVALAIGAAPLPYGFYTLLRIVTTGAFVWAAYVSHYRKNMSLLFAYGVLAALFNPIIPVYLTKELWAIIDVSAAIFLVATRQRIQEPRSNPTD